MVSTRKKTVIAPPSTIASGRAYKTLRGFRMRRRLANRKMAAWNKSNRSSRSSSKLPLSPSIIAASEWTTPPSYRETGPPASDIPNITEPIAGRLLRRRVGNPTCLHFTPRREVLYPDHYFCHSCHLIDHEFNEFKLKHPTIPGSKFNPNCSAHHTSWHFPTTKKKQGRIYQPLAGALKRRLDFDITLPSAAATAPEQEPRTTSPCPSLELACRMSDMSLTKESDNNLLPEVGRNGAIFSPPRNGAVADPLPHRSPPSTLIIRRGQSPEMSPLAEREDLHTEAIALNLQLTQKIEQTQELVQQLRKDLLEQSSLVFSFKLRLRRAKKANKKLQPVLSLLDDNENDPEPGQLRLYYRKKQNDSFQWLVHAAIDCVIVHDPNFCRWQDVGSWIRVVSTAKFFVYKAAVSGGDVKD
jgi:hypothetical protein